MMDDVLVALKAARELISDPSRWVTETAACDAEGCLVSPHADTAVRFCAAGALMKVCGAEIHNHVPVSALAWIGCHGPAQQEQIQAEVVRLALSIKVAARPGWYV